MSAHQVTGTLAQPRIIDLPLEIGSTGKREFALRERRPNRARRIRKKTGRGPAPAIWVDWVEIEGPPPAPPRHLAGGSFARSDRGARGDRAFRRARLPRTEAGAGVSRPVVQLF